MLVNVKFCMSLIINSEISLKMMLSQGTILIELSMIMKKMNNIQLII